ncbi:MAG: hypothetical protein K5829_07160 [Treponema sp.]|nr:hypothetical protein [Treponema sp.]
MRNLKFPVSFAIFGFALSLFFGFFSGSHFGVIILRALIFAVVFFAIGFVIKMIYGKFLYDDTASDFEGDQLGNTESSTPSDSSVKGQHVDLVIKDEELESETSDNHYVVGSNHQMLSESDLKKNSASSRQDSSLSKEFAASSSGELASSPDENSDLQKSSQTEEKAPEFVPLGKENFNKISGVEAVQSENIQASIIRPVENSSGSELDVLPDMADLDMSDSSESVEDAETDDAEFVSSALASKKNESEGTEVKDASLMAKAISSLLSSES